MQIVSQRRDIVIKKRRFQLDVPIQETNIQLICDANGPPPSLMPSSAYVDVSNAAIAQGMYRHFFLFISYTNRRSSNP